jgi:hypothetical protein
LIKALLAKFSTPPPPAHLNKSLTWESTAAEVRDVLRLVGWILFAGFMWGRMLRFLMYTKAEWRKR